jgi:hypothetical protein
MQSESAPRSAASLTGWPWWAQGGPITQVEQEEMAAILSEAKADAQKSGVVLSTSLVTMEYSDFLSRYP